MKKSFPFLSLLLILGLVYYSFYSLMPQKGTSASIPENEFSTERALIPLKEISKAPHYYGSNEHKRVGTFLENELKSLGMETQTQEGFVLSIDEKKLVKPKNIIGRFKGSEEGKALLLLSHYDSALVPSYGASDAGSGVVTILESLRAYFANDKTPKNDIIVLFSDCEEISLGGASLFVNEHPWAKDVGFVMNFEARGSGGPSVMILESNAGNAKLVDAFIEANPEYPVASSLMYSVYKILPNSTDSTVFRVEGDIDSFFFAFIDDHFDYHTANDTVENLDIETLQHQGSYLLPLLSYFADVDLSDLKATEDKVYVNLPLIKMISYPFSWILPMVIIAAGLLIVLVFFGIKKNKIDTRGIRKGFISLLISLVISGFVGFFGWQLLLKIYPQYEEVQQGFKYNGHSYIAFFLFLSLAILFWAYRKLTEKEKVASIFVPSIILWVIINTMVFAYLKGAGFFIIPVFFGLLALWVLIRQEKPNLLLMTLLSAPAIFILAPLIQFFPVALGSKMVVISCVFTVLLFGLLLPVFGHYKNKKFLSILCFLVAFVFLINAHFKSDFSETRQKPNSLVYYQDADTQKAYWMTYDKILDSWTKGYLGENPSKPSEVIAMTPTSKYSSGYTFASEAPIKTIPSFNTVLKYDTIIENKRNVSFTILPKRNTNKIDLYADKNISFHSLSYNGKSAPADNEWANEGRISDELLQYYLSNNDSLEVSFSVHVPPEALAEGQEKNTPISFTAIEYSYDLLSHPEFTINRRPKDMMPKPFVVTDAIAIKKTIDINTMQKKTQDTLLQTILLNE